MTALAQLPYELLRDILDQCDLRTVVRFARAGRLWRYRLLGDDRLWRRQYQRDFGLADEEAEWRTWYLDCEDADRDGGDGGHDDSDQDSECSSCDEDRNGSWCAAAAASIRDEEAGEAVAASCEHGSDRSVGRSRTATMRDPSIRAHHPPPPPSKRMQRRPRRASRVSHGSQWSDAHGSLQVATSVDPAGKPVRNRTLCYRHRRHHRSDSVRLQMLRFSWFSMYTRRVHLESNFLWACLGDRGRCQAPWPPPLALSSRGPHLCECYKHEADYYHYRHYHHSHYMGVCAVHSNSGGRSTAWRLGWRQWLCWSSLLSPRTSPNLRLMPSLRRRMAAAAHRLPDTGHVDASSVNAASQAEHIWRLALAPHPDDADFYHACRNFFLQPSIGRLAAEAAPPTLAVYLWRVEEPSLSRSSWLELLARFRCGTTASDSSEGCKRDGEADESPGVLWIAVSVDAYTAMLLQCRDHRPFDWWLAEAGLHRTNKRATGAAASSLADQLRLRISKRPPHASSGDIHRTSTWQRLHSASREKACEASTATATITAAITASTATVLTNVLNVPALPMGFRLLRRQSPVTAHLYAATEAPMHAPAPTVRLLKCGHALGDAARSVDIRHVIARQSYPNLASNDTSPADTPATAGSTKDSMARDDATLAQSDQTPVHTVVDVDADRMSSLIPHTWCTVDPTTGQRLPVVLLTASCRVSETDRGGLSNDALW
ncbi:hypothetical protein THASP1DRAFT_30529 [Thamnocephalis sphaerospora]|uniref:F-box domain-containing protein n=1 Tax=Thamnocephalis sphaerospora TaxID=78915 RepID=A0A4P9XP62_9FUNG|nr:hypothetical protein THASP1DRAFT_30529 [Thamnocephalis sphaerospora]|eukprot:RKP07652.1 hypothetical protein THASP1DRAFT_30529 [Thamnocephalis sphaerospora]